MSNTHEEGISIVMIGATGAVGGHAAKMLAAHPAVRRLTLLGRRPVQGLAQERVQQHTVDLLDPESYRAHIEGHEVAICTVGVGEPSKVSREEFLKIDHTLPLTFARTCKEAGVRHFELLSSVGVSASSRSFFLRSKGELEEGLKALQFDRLSLFHPSMILTPENRYGFAQAVTLKVWPVLTPLLFGGLRPYRGVRVDVLGRAIAENALISGHGVEVLEWDDFESLAGEG